MRPELLYMSSQVLKSSIPSLIWMHYFIPHYSQHLTYLVLQFFRLLMPVEAPMHTPDKVMKVVLVELFTVGFIHRRQDFTDGSL